MKKAARLPEVSVDVTCTTHPSMASSILSKTIAVRKVLGFGGTALRGKEAGTGSKHVISTACFFPLTIF